MGIRYLRKASDLLVSGCRCGDGRITYPPQMGCPWCGCGWLFSCITCRIAFTFAEAVELDTSWEELAHQDLWGFKGVKASKSECASWVKFMRGMLSDISPGSLYVILDGRVFPITAQNIEFHGIRTKHRLASMPQAAALNDPSILDRVLRNPSYWDSELAKSYG